MSFFCLKIPRGFHCTPRESLGSKLQSTMPSRSSPLLFCPLLCHSPLTYLTPAPWTTGHCSNKPGAPSGVGLALVLSLLSRTPFLDISWLMPHLPVPARMSLPNYLFMGRSPQPRLPLTLLISPPCSFCALTPSALSSSTILDHVLIYCGVSLVCGLYSQSRILAPWGDFYFYLFCS